MDGARVFWAVMEERYMVATVSTTGDCDPGCKLGHIYMDDPLVIEALASAPTAMEAADRIARLVGLAPVSDHNTPEEMAENKTRLEAYYAARRRLQHAEPIILAIEKAR